MKKYIFLILILISGIQISFAQTAYKYVIIPTTFPDIGKGFNPYNISAELQNIFNRKGIKTVFYSDERPLDYCDALNLNLEKTSTAFKNKVKVILKDCQNREIWSNEGVGMSKDFKNGYAEALTDALSDLEKLPQRKTPIVTVQNTQAVTQAKKTEVIESNKDEEIYRPKNLYYNETYFVDLLEIDNATKELLIINGKLLGYEKQQKIATLTSTGAQNIYNVTWTTPQGETLQGAAVFGNGNITITLSSDDKPVVIKLEKQ